ncbi:hypothetical protein B566_EDAN012374 [Ephemera danica]|nr:hypothetical protein B566_EDAN012374 [Ephemera danica]
MCELTEVPYMPGDVVWVKLGSCWWPGEVKDIDSLPEEITTALKKRPLAVVKFFGEDSYEYVKNLDNIYHYNNRRKMEFIKKGMDLTRAKTKQGSNLMDKFPTDVVTAESLTKGDINILSTVAFVPEERPQYKDLFGDPKKKSPKKGGIGSKYPNERSPVQSILGKVKPLIQLKHRITHPRFVRESDHEVRIRQQPNASPKSDTVVHAYQCQQCDFGTSRQNVFILHCKAHRENIIQPSSATKSAKNSQSKSKRTPKSAGSTSTKSSKTPSTSSVREKKLPAASSTNVNRKIFTPKKSTKKGSNAKATLNVSVGNTSVEMKERDSEKRNKILADWDEEDDEEEEKEIKKFKLELDQKEESRISELQNHRSEQAVAKPEAAAAPTSDPSSVYDLIDDADEDFVPPPRLSETKRIPVEPAAVPTESADTRELDKEFVALLEETAVPDIPQVPTIPTPAAKPDLPPEEVDIPVEADACASPTQNSSEKVEASNQGKDEEMVPIKEQTDVVDGSVDSSEAVETNQIVEPDMTVPVSSVSTVETTEESKPMETQILQQQTQEVLLDPNTETATYVLVTIDDSGGFQQFQTLEGMGNTTLLAYDSSQGEEGGTRTLYIDPSQLSGAGTGLENLFLAIDAPDGSGASMVQIQPNQVLQVSNGNPTPVVTTDGKSKPDILAVALANTQVLQPSIMESHVMGQDAVVKVTNAAQSPVMTPRIADSQVVTTSGNKFLVPSQLVHHSGENVNSTTVITLAEDVRNVR